MYIMERGILLDWMRLIQHGGNISGFFIRNNISDIIIYGAGDIGIKFYEDIKNCGVNVRCVFDKSVRYIDEKVEVCDPTDIENISFVDCVVIISSIIYFEEIYDFLRAKIGEDVEIYGIEDIIYDEMLNLKDFQQDSL